MAYDVLVLFLPTYLGPNVIHVHCTVSRAFDGHHLGMQCNLIQQSQSNITITTNLNFTIIVTLIILIKSCW